MQRYVKEFADGETGLYGSDAREARGLRACAGNIVSGWHIIYQRCHVRRRARAKSAIIALSKSIDQINISWLGKLQAVRYL